MKTIVICIIIAWLILFNIVPIIAKHINKLKFSNKHKKYFDER